MSAQDAMDSMAQPDPCGMTWASGCTQCAGVPMLSHIHSIVSYPCQRDTGCISRDPLPWAPGRFLWTAGGL